MKEEIRPEYINDAYLVAPPYFNYRVNVRGERHYLRYYEDGTVISAPSFTAVKRYAGSTGLGLEQWFKNNSPEYVEWYLEHSANYGTWFHAQAGRILREEVIEFEREIIEMGMAAFLAAEGLDFQGCIDWMKKTKRNPLKDLYGFVKWAQDYKVVPIAIEYPVMHPSGLWAGTIDIICKATSMKTGERITLMVDIKTGYNFYEDHAIQLHAYSTLWNREWPDLPVQRVFNYGCKDYRLKSLSRANFQPYNFKDQTDNPTNYKWIKWVEMYHLDPKNKLNLKRTDFKPGQISLKSNLEDLVETIDYLIPEKKGETI